MQFSEFGLAAVFYRWYELLKFENIVSPYFEFRFHPMKWPLIFQSLWFSQPGFSSGTWTAISSSSWDSCTFYPLWRFFFAAMPPWQSWGQSSWNNWRDDKNKYPFDCDKALQYPEVVTPNTWKPTSTFYDENVSFGLQFHRTIQPTNSAPLLPLDALAVFSFVRKADWKSSYTSLFALRYCGQVLFPLRADQLLATRHV